MMNLSTDKLIGLAWSQIWQVTVLLAIVAVATRLVCRRRPHLAYVLWMLVILKCLTRPLWSSPTSFFSWAQFRIAPVESVVQSNDADMVAMPAPAPDDEQPMASVFERRQRREFSIESATAVTPSVPAPVIAAPPIAVESPVSTWWDRVSPQPSVPRPRTR